MWQNSPWLHPRVRLGSVCSDGLKLRLSSLSTPANRSQKELWLPHLSADSVVRAGILRDDALAGDASGSGGSGGGGSSSSMADPHVNDTIPFCSLMAGADGIAGLVLPEEKGKYFRAVGVCRGRPPRSTAVCEFAPLLAWRTTPLIMV